MTPSEKEYHKFKALLEENSIVRHEVDNEIDWRAAELQQFKNLKYELTEEKRTLERNLAQAEAKYIQEKEDAEARFIDFELIAPFYNEALRLTPQLLEFQKEDVAFTLDRIIRCNPEKYNITKEDLVPVGNGVLNCNDMGLGKTVETTSTLKAFPNANVLWLTKRGVVQSTASLCSAWGYEILPLVARTSPEKSMLINYAHQMPFPTRLIANYETLNTNLPDLEKVEWDFIVIDEAHKLKGGANFRPTQLWTNAKKLLTEQTASHSCFPIFLTGSPISNSITEVWAYLHLFDPIRFKSKAVFENMFSLNFQKDQLLRALAPNMIRRRKDEVGIQLPPKQYRTHSIEQPPHFKKLYNELADQMFAKFPEGELSLTNVLQQLHYLRAISVAPGTLKVTSTEVNPDTLEQLPKQERHLTFQPSYPKLDYCFDLVCELLENEETESESGYTSHPGGVVIWSAQYNKPLEYLNQLFLDCGYTTGIIKGSTKDASILEKKFQDGEIQILLVNLKSAAEGFNFQRSNEWKGGAAHSVFLDKWYNPTPMNQAEDRIWRVGTNLPVTIHYLDLEDSVDQFIDDILERKKSTAEGITESNMIRPASEWVDELKKIFKKD